jgi:hypothetical protein
VITNALLDILNTVIDWIITVRPTWTMTLPTGVTGFVSTVLSYDEYVPIHEGLNCIYLTCTVITALQGWKWTVKLVDWIMDVIP